MTLGTLLLLTALAMVVIIFGSGYYFRWVFQRMVLNGLRDLDTVRGTRLAPAQWQKGYHKRIQQATYDVRLWEKQRRSNLKRLRSLERFARKTNLMDGEEIRQAVLRELSSIRTEWEALSPGDPL